MMDQRRGKRTAQRVDHFRPEPEQRALGGQRGEGHRWLAAVVVAVSMPFVQRPGREIHRGQIDHDLTTLGMGDGPSAGESRERLLGIAVGTGGSKRASGEKYYGCG